MRPIRCTYDPSAKILGQPPRLESFSFMSNTNGRNHELEHAVILDPTALAVPWPTSFPVAMQCKHWEAAEIAARELIDKVIQSKAEDKGILPEDMEKLTTSGAQAKMHELLDTSVSITVNVWPWASAKRIGLIAQGCLLLFLHDGRYIDLLLFGCLILTVAIVQMLWSLNYTQKGYVVYSNPRLI